MFFNQLGNGKEMLGHFPYWLMDSHPHEFGFGTDSHHISLHFLNGLVQLGKSSPETMGFLPSNI